jgi:transcription elongation GreA/GreB family factor
MWVKLLNREAIRRFSKRVISVDPEVGKILISKGIGQEVEIKKKNTKEEVTEEEVEDVSCFFPELLKLCDGEK